MATATEISRLAPAGQAGPRRKPLDPETTKSTI